MSTFRTNLQKRCGADPISSNTPFSQLFCRAIRNQQQDLEIAVLPHRHHRPVCDRCRNDSMACRGMRFEAVSPRTSHRCALIAAHSGLSAPSSHAKTSTFCRLKLSVRSGRPSLLLFLLLFCAFTDPTQRPSSKPRTLCRRPPCNFTPTAPSAVRAPDPLAAASLSCSCTDQEKRPAGVAPVHARVEGVEV